MESTSFEFTSEQKSLLASLARETGKPVSALIAEALAGLEGQVRNAHSNEGMSGSDKAQSPHPPKARKPIWELFEEASRKIPDEELDRLPTDLAAQVDHYIYGTPKR